MKRNFLKFASLVLASLLLLCACGDKTKNEQETSAETKGEETNTVTVTDDHIHFFGSWKTVKAATCIATGTQERSCACGEKETKSFAEPTHRYGNWITQKTATCTVNGVRECTCSLCGDRKTETVKATGHNYENYVCTNCGDYKLNINIKLPQTPVTIHDYRYDDSIKTSCKITSVRWEIGYYSESSRDVWIYLYWSGEQTYNYEGNNISSSCGIGYKLYDSEGYVVDSGTSSSTPVQKGEKFKDALITIPDLDPNESYTLEFLDVK